MLISLAAGVTERQEQRHSDRPDLQQQWSLQVRGLHGGAALQNCLRHQQPHRHG